MTEPKKQIEQDAITVVAKLAGKSARFTLRMISMQEEQQLRQRFTALNDGDQTDRIEKEYQINKDALIKFNLADVEQEQIGESLKYISITDFFAERTPFTERIAEFVTRGFLQQLNPEISFK